MTLDEFEEEVTKAYDELPPEVSGKFTIVIDEEREDVFGYFHGMFPRTLMICYKTCSGHPNPSAHIRRVIHHEVEHILFPSYTHSHSEHSHE